MQVIHNEVLNKLIEKTGLLVQVGYSTTSCKGLDCFLRVGVAETIMGGSVC